MMNVYYQLYLYNKKHKIIHKTKPIQAKSFVKAFLQLLYVCMSAVTENIIDTSNTSRSCSSLTFWPYSVPHPGLSSGHVGGADSSGAVFVNTISLYTDQVGIQCGTSTTAVAVADDNLVTPIVNGTSSGNFLNYGTWGGNYATGASTCTFDVEAIFGNSSGGNITVNEIGMYCGAIADSGNQRSFCILRDIVSPAITVNNGQYFKVKYTISVSN